MTRRDITPAGYDGGVDTPAIDPTAAVEALVAQAEAARVVALAGMPTAPTHITVLRDLSPLGR